MRGRPRALRERRLVHAEAGEVVDPVGREREVAERGVGGPHPEEVEADEETEGDAEARAERVAAVERTRVEVERLTAEEVALAVPVLFLFVVGRG